MTYNGRFRKMSRATSRSPTVHTRQKREVPDKNELLKLFGGEA